MKKARKGKGLKTYKPSPLLNKILTKNSDALKNNFDFRQKYKSGNFLSFFLSSSVFFPIGSKRMSCPISCRLILAKLSFTSRLL
jgi:hypothetical protein